LEKESLEVLGKRVWVGRRGRNQRSAYD